MNTENWQKVKEVFYSALNTPESDRVAYLDEACSGQPAFRSEVEMLLNSYEQSFLEDSLWPDRIDDETPIKQFFIAGDEFSHYRIVKLIGRGGMGEVYLADDRSLGRSVAIKVVSEGSRFGKMAEKRLLREARAAARLDHPNICAVYEVGETEGRPFIAMQYVDGETLDARIKRGPIPIDECVLITRKIAAALSEAHRRGIVHRDIKPANIIIDARGELKVLDFGLAKESLMAEGTNESQLSEVGIIAGTAAFMSPEQTRGQELDARSDIWSLGVVFYQMITGRMPFTGETNADTVAAILSQELVLPSVHNDEISGSVNYIIDRTLQKDRDKRYASIGELDSDLLASSSGLLTYSLPTDAIGQVKKKFRTAQIALFAALLVLLAAGSGAWWVSSSKGRERTPFASASPANFIVNKIYSAKRRPSGNLSGLSISPDGQFVAFHISEDSDHSSLYVNRASSGSEPVAITDGSFNDHSPVWSADSQHLAFVSDRDGSAGIWSVSFQGGTPNLLTKLAGTSAHYYLRKWSNDGRRIFLRVIDSAKTLYLDDGHLENIEFRGAQGKVLSHFGFSFDDQKVSFLTEEGGTYRLWAQSIESGDAEMIGESDSYTGPPAWFPNNELLVYSAFHNGISQIFVKDAKGGEPRQVTFGDQNVVDPVVSTDGTHIAYYSSPDEANIFSLDIGSGRETSLTSELDAQLFPVFSPDGKNIAFQTTNEGSRIWNSSLKILPISDPAGMIPLPKEGFDPKWSPSGRELAYVRPEDGLRILWKYNLDSQKESRLSTASVKSVGHATVPYNLFDSQFAWSPDGSTVTFASGQTGMMNIWTVASDGTNEHQITSVKGSASLSSPIWSRDGSKIAVIESNGDKLFGYLSNENRVAVLENGNVRYVSERIGQMTLLGWASDDKSIFFIVKRGENFEMRVARVDASISNSIGDLSIARIEGIRLSPDGKTMAYSSQTGLIENLYTMSISGGEPTKVTRNEDPTILYSGISWSPDGKTLLYSKQTGNSQISVISDPK